MKFKLATTVLAAVITLNTCALAAANYNSNENKIIVSNDDGLYLNVTVVKSGVNLNELGNTDKNGNKILPLYTKSYTPGEKIEIPMPIEAPSGNYMVYCGDNLELDFFYVNRSEADDFVKNVINKATSADNLKDIINSNYDKIGFSLRGDETDSDVCKLLYKGIAYADYTAFSFAFSDCLKKTDVLLAQNTSDFIAKLEQNGVDTKEIKKESQTVQNKLYQLVKQDDLSEITLEEAVSRNFIAAKCITAEHYTTLKNLIEKNAEILSIDFTNTYYASLKDNTQVYIKMFESISTLNSAKEIGELFEESVNYVYEKENPKTPASGLGGGGSSKPSIGVNIGTIKTEDTNLPTVPTSIGFPDMNKAPWAKEAVEELTKDGVISGREDGNFDPDGLVTRAEVAKMIYLAFSVPKGQAKFNDVEDSAWYAEAVSALAAVGIVKGDGEFFYPNHPITREDFAVMLMRLAEYMGKRFDGEKSFIDSTEISDYAIDSVSALSANGIINGSDGKFMPKSNASRAQAAVLIYNLKKAME